MKRKFILPAIFTLLFAGNLWAQWSSNTSQNLQLCSGSGNQYTPAVVSDGSGGVISAWIDERTVNTQKIYVQRYNASGMAMWQANGVELVPSQTNASDIQCVADGNGGVIICWLESRSGMVAMYYARKINSSGVPQWASEVGVSEPYNAANNDERCCIAPDGNGGVLMAYKRYSNTVSKFEIHCQNISSDGSRYFGTGGSVVATSVNSASFENPKVCADETGGAILVYERNSRIFSQRLNNLGQKQWGSEGFDVFGSTVGNMFIPVICKDGVGGAIIACIDQRVPSNNFDIYAQRVKNGSSMWGTGGKPIALGTARQWIPKITYDNNFGAYIAWQDERESADSTKPYVQRIDLAGNLYFQLNGIRMDPYKCSIIDITSGDSTSVHAIVASGNTYPQFNINVQKISSSGNFPWGVNPIPLSTSFSTKSFSKYPITVDNSGALICVWDDNRGNPAIKVYGHKIQSSGLTGFTNTGEIPESFKLDQNYPNPFNPSTRISFSIAEKSNVTLKVYDAGGSEVKTLLNSEMQAGRHTVQFNAGSLSSGIYFYTLQANGFSETRKMILVK